MADLKITGTSRYVKINIATRNAAPPLLLGLACSGAVTCHACTLPRIHHVAPAQQLLALPGLAPSHHCWAGH